MQLCHKKNAQLGCEMWSYKGRLVFRGDCVRDQDGNWGVWTEQGTSSSHLMAARVVDAVGNMEGMCSEDADATSAYAQTDLAPDCPPTWISLPRDRWPDEWYGEDGTDKYVNPVVRLKSNFYGHPCAGPAVTSPWRCQ